MKRKIYYLMFTSFYFLLNTSIINANSQNIYIKNFRELPMSLEHATGVSRFYADIFNFYNRNSNTFPQFGIFDELGSDFLFVNTSYASLFCNRMILSDKNKTPANRWIHTLLDFNQNPNQVPNDILIFTLNEYSQIFYQRDLEENEKNYFIELYKELPKHIEQSPLSTHLLWLGICTTFGTSFDFLRKL